MNVQEALEKQVGDTLCGRCSFDPCRACIAHEVKQHFVEGLAPIIERALRAAYQEGFGQAKDGFLQPDDAYGITASIAAMMEES